MIGGSLKTVASELA